MQELTDVYLGLIEYLEMRLKATHDRDEENLIKEQMERLEDAKNEATIEMLKTIESITAIMFREEDKTVEYVSKDELPQECQWCGTHISDDQGCTGLDLKFAPHFKKMVKGGKGPTLRTKLYMINKDIDLVLAPKGSEVEREGVDAMVLLCSEECGQALKDALKKEKPLFYPTN